MSAANPLEAYTNANIEALLKSHFIAYHTPDSFMLLLTQ
jgi:hypothetical protein